MDSIDLHEQAAGGIPLSMPDAASWHAGLVLAPLLTLPEALPLGVDSAIAQEEATEASPPSPTPAVSSTPEARSPLLLCLSVLQQR